MARKVAYRLEEVRSYRVVRVEYDEDDEAESVSKISRPFKRYVDIDRAHDQIERLMKRDRKAIAPENMHVTGTVKNWRQFIRNGGLTDVYTSRAYSGFRKLAGG